mmetsp:Transcript_63334/g.100630  ORF Transcript_63334/g.100630 Transcript_63334/m.100630 type:complete len:102 (-) Transcript_63334:37-342(-)
MNQILMSNRLTKLTFAQLGQRRCRDMLRMYSQEQRWRNRRPCKASFGKLQLDISKLRSPRCQAHPCRGLVKLQPQGIRCQLRSMWRLFQRRFTAHDYAEPM